MKIILILPITALICLGFILAAIWFCRAFNFNGGEYVALVFGIIILIVTLFIGAGFLIAKWTKND